MQFLCTFCKRFEVGVGVCYGCSCDISLFALFSGPPSLDVLFYYLIFQPHRLRSVKLLLSIYRCFFHLYSLLPRQITSSGTALAQVNLFPPTFLASWICCRSLVRSGIFEFVTFKERNSEISRSVTWVVWFIHSLFYSVNQFLPITCANDILSDSDVMEFCIVHPSITSMYSFLAWTSLSSLLCTELAWTHLKWTNHWI